MVYFIQRIYHKSKMELKEFCIKLEIDYTNMISKFGNNEMLYNRFLKKFLEDKTYSELEIAMEKENYNDIEKTAHTLKGVSANLGITRLYKLSDELVKLVRTKQYENLTKTYEKLREEYKITKEMINEL